MDPLDARARFRELREQDGPVDPAELDRTRAASTTGRPETVRRPAGHRVPRSRTSARP
ncbi:hypothetical protein ABZ871_32095 [Streptomyces populi]